LNKKNTRPIQKIFLLLGSIFALLLITAGILGFLVTGPAPREAEARPIPVTYEAAQSLDDKIEALRQQVNEASAMGRRIEVTLVTTEEEATSRVIQLSRSGEIKMDIEFAQINFIDGRVYAFGKADLLININISLEAEVEVKDGEPDIKIRSLHLGRLPIPGTLVGQIMRAVMNHYQERLDSIRVDLEEITIGNGEMTFRGRSR
jgi:uncharacterized protein YpmS